MLMDLTNSGIPIITVHSFIPLVTGGTSDITVLLGIFLVFKVVFPSLVTTLYNVFFLLV